MTDALQRLAERRVLILTPTGRDAPLTRDILAETGIRSVACDDLAQLVGELDVGAGVLLRHQLRRFDRRQCLTEA